MDTSSAPDHISSEKERFLDRLTPVLEKQIDSGELSVEETSQKLGISRSTLYRKMKNFTGFSPAEYVKEFQLKKAAQLLEAEYGNVSEVAYETGFNNLSYFAKCFKERFGVTPGKYTLVNRIDYNFSVQITSFVGRRQELSELKNLISRYRLINLTGPAGTGKTRLALEVVNRLKDNFKHGIFAIHLASLSDPELVPSAILKELRIMEHPARSSMQSLIAHLKNREVLLLLDNFEHVIQAASKIDRLLRQCPDLKIMVTSREVLHLTGEFQYLVSPLSVPEPYDEISDSALETLKECPAVKLFLARARTVTGDFHLTKKNAADITRITRHLDGLPLALELAASQIKVLSPNSLAERLKESLAVLISDDMDRPPRHHTLLSAITWSYELLTEKERSLFQRLSLFSGSFNLEAAEIVWNDHSADLDILDGIRTLINKNFLQSFEKNGEVRFRILETLKAFGRDKLFESNKQKEIIRKMAGFFLQMAQEAEPQLKGPRQKFWVDRLGAELDNLRGILSYLHEYREVELGLQLSTALCRYWNMQNLMKEGREWLRKMIDLSNTLKYHEVSEQINILKGRALSALGVLVGQLSKNFREAADIFRQCITVFRRIDDKNGLAENLNHYGWIKAHLGDYNEGTTISNEAKNLCEKLNNHRGISVALNNLGWIENTRGNLPEASELFSKSVDLRNNIGDLRGSAYVSANLAWVEKNMGKYESALARLEQSLDILEELDDRQLISWIQTIKGYICYDKARFPKAQTLLEKAIEGWSQVGNRYGLSLANDLLGLTYLALNKPQLAISRFEQVHPYWQEMNSKWGLAFSFYCLAQYRGHTNQSEQALSIHKKALSLRIEQREQLYICESLEACAPLMAVQGDYEAVSVSLSAATSLRDKINASRPPRFGETYEQLITNCKKELGEQTFKKAWEEGRKHHPLENGLPSKLTRIPSQG